MLYYILAKIHCNPVTYIEGHDGLPTSHGYITFLPYWLYHDLLFRKMLFYYQVYEIVCAQF
jgi:hypothetical protein